MLVDFVWSMKQKKNSGLKDYKDELIRIEILAESSLLLNNNSSNNNDILRDIRK